MRVGIPGRRRERLPGEAHARAPFEAGVDVRQSERGHVVRPGLVVGPEAADVEGERLAERPLEPRLQREADAVRGLGGAVAGLEVLGRGLLIEQLAARMDALDPHAALQVGAEARAGPEDAGDAEGRLETGPLLVGSEPQRLRLGGDVGVLGRVHRPELQANAEAPPAGRTLLRDPSLPLDGLLEDVPVLAVGCSEAEAAEEMPAGRRLGERRGVWARRALSLGGGGDRQARGEHNGVQCPKFNRHIRFSSSRDQLPPVLRDRSINSTASVVDAYLRVPARTPIVTCSIRAGAHLDSEAGLTH